MHATQLSNKPSRSIGQQRPIQLISDQSFRLPTQLTGAKLTKRLYCPIRSDILYPVGLKGSCNPLPSSRQFWCSFRLDCWVYRHGYRSSEARPTSPSLAWARLGEYWEYYYFCELSVFSGWNSSRDFWRLAVGQKMIMFILYRYGGRSLTFLDGSRYFFNSSGAPKWMSIVSFPIQVIL